MIGASLVGIDHVETILCLFVSVNHCRRTREESGLDEIDAVRGAPTSNPLAATLESLCRKAGSMRRFLPSTPNVPMTHLNAQKSLTDTLVQSEFARPSRHRRHAVLLFHWGSRLGHFREVRPALVVSAFDTQWDFGMGLDFGFLGVSLFFILSGYLLTSQLISRDVTATIASRFWQRHGLRIYLAFWLQLIVLLVLAHFLDFMPQMSSVGDLIRHALLWIYLPPWATAPMNAVWWTLPVELGFYLVVPFLVVLASRVGPVAVVVGGLAITMIWRFAVMEAYAGENYFGHLWILDSIPGSLFIFCIGFGLAYGLGRRPRLSARFRHGLLAAALLALIGGSLILAAMSYYAVEKPIMRRRRK
jgi:peptidoglycan/LPS O-acetylase OafA/YrhL